MLGQDAVEDAEEPGDRDAEREQDRRAAPTALGDPAQRAGESRQARRQADRSQAPGGVEGLVRRHLAHDQQPDSGREVAPEADREGEHQRARRPLQAGSAREEAEQGGGEAPDGDEEEKRDPRVPGELVEGKRVADDGTGQRDVRPEQVEPARRGDDDPEAGERGECEPDPTHARGGSLPRGAPARSFSPPIDRVPTWPAPRRQ